MNQSSQGQTGAMDRFLSVIERVGNALPDPASLFCIGILIVLALSLVGERLGWSVERIRLEAVPHDISGAGGGAAEGSSDRPHTRIVPTGERISPRNLLSRDGLYWCVSGMVKNFVEFPPLGIVLVGMLGIGVAESVGLFGATLKWMAGILPRRLLTPCVVFLGVMSNIAGDSGYVVLPAVSAALYAAVGRSPLVGIAAAFAGIAGGFSANLLVGGTDTLCAGITEKATQLLEPDVLVPATCNWWFLIASTFMLTLLGWAVTAWVVEPRLRCRAESDGGPPERAGGGAEPLSAAERRGLRAAMFGAVGALAFTLALIWLPGAALHGDAVNADGRVIGSRWVQSMVPIVFFGFLVPGLCYGVAAGKIAGQKDAVRCMVKAMEDIAPILVLSFFASQFIALFKESRLGEMLAISGGTALARADMPVWLVLVLFIIVSLSINLMISSMSAKWAMLAPIFVPMFMVLGIHPALTQAAYRVGDSVTNCVTPLNAYLVIILAVMHRYAGKAGMGTIIATMAPYSVTFAVFWTLLLLAWMGLGVPLGPGGPLYYTPAGP